MTLRSMTLRLMTRRLMTHWLMTHWLMTQRQAHLNSNPQPNGGHLGFSTYR